MFGMHGNRVRRPSERVRRQGRARTLVQCACAALANGYAVGFLRGKVFSGPSKALCVPVLNCSSCPGALGSCPIGALQAVGGSTRHTASFYVLGTLALFGVVFGRLICGFACPFGFVQDLLARIPLPKVVVPARLDRVLRKVKYLVLGFLVIGLPVMAVVTGGNVAPLFCKLLCPAGTLEAGLPLVATNPSLQRLVGFLFNWKVLVLVAVVVLSTIVRRPFCKWLCPLGAFQPGVHPLRRMQGNLPRQRHHHVLQTHPKGTVPDGLVQKGPSLPVQSRPMWAIGVHLLH